MLEKLKQALLKIVSDTKFWFQLFALCHVIGMTLFPNLPDDFWRNLDALVAIIVSSFIGGKYVGTQSVMAKLVLPKK